MDSLYISSIELRTRIGVPEKERTQEQALHVSVELFLNTKESARDDDFTKSIDYERVTNDIYALGKTERKTIERLAEDIADMILTKYKPESVKVSVWKDVIPNTKGVCITIMRP